MPPLTDIDLPTASLILEIQLRDLAALEDRRKGKEREGDSSVLSDADLALALYKHELEGVEQFLADGRLARSIFDAVTADRAALAAHVKEEDRAARDRAFAREVDARDNDDGNGDDNGGGCQGIGMNVKRTGGGGQGSSQGVRGPTHDRQGPNNDVKKPKVDGKIAGQTWNVQGPMGQQQQVDIRGLKRMAEAVQGQARDAKRFIDDKMAIGQFQAVRWPGQTMQQIGVKRPAGTQGPTGDIKRFKGPSAGVNLPRPVKQWVQTKQQVDNRNLMRPTEVYGQTRGVMRFDCPKVVVNLPQAAKGPGDTKQQIKNKALNRPAAAVRSQTRPTINLRCYQVVVNLPQAVKGPVATKQQTNNTGLKRPASHAYSNIDIGTGHWTNYPSPEIDHGGSSKRRKLTTTTSATQQEAPKTGSECSICLFRYPAFTMLSLPCQHFACKTCLQTLFRRASIDEESFPPRCCQTIPLENARIFLSTPIIAAFEKAKTEYEAQNRIYCSQPRCSLFIPPANISVDYACCTKCGMVTCTHCRAEYHEGECPKDDALQKLLQTASKKGWKRCYVPLRCALLLPMREKVEDVSMSKVGGKATSFGSKGTKPWPPKTTGNATSALILQLQHDDIVAMQENTKGKELLGAESDADLAIELYRPELQNMEQSTYRDEERQAVEDRALAQRLGKQGHREASLGQTDDPSDASDQAREVTNRSLGCRRPVNARATDLAVGVVRRPVATKVEVGPSCSPSAIEGNHKREAECTIYAEREPEFTMLLPPCGHLLCRACVQKLFQNAIDDETSFPPKCCQKIPLETAQTFLTSAIVVAFTEASREYQTPNRFYCSRKQCSVFIPPENVGNEFASCSACGMVTCIHCKSEYHDGDRPKDGALQELLKAASSAGWN